MTAWQLPDRVPVSGGEVAAGSFGSGPPVVLTHGTPARAHLWRRVVPRLAAHHTVHVWDLLGYGDSRLAPGATPSIARQARTLAELVAHWDLDAPALVGHDIGGGIVARAHLIEDVDSRALALLDAAVIGPWNTPFTQHLRDHSQAYRTMPGDVFADIINPRIKSAVHHRLSEATVEAYLAPWRGESGQRRWMDQVVAVDHADTSEAVVRLPQISAPTLVLWGEQDTWLPPSAGDRLASAIPGARLVRVADAGHFLPEDAPEEVADALLQHFAPVR